MLVAVVSPPPGATLVDKSQWLATGFNEAGHSVIRCHTLTDLAAADKIATLVVLDQKGAGLNHSNLAELAAVRRAAWCCCWRDLIAWDRVPLAEQDDLKLFARMMRRMDVLFVKERDTAAELRSLGIHGLYMDTQGCPVDMPACEHTTSPEFDCLVLGRTDYPQRRADVRTLVDAGYRVVWAGLPDGVGVPEGVTAHPWVHPTRELPTIASRCAVALSVDATHRNGYTSDRTWLLSGCGIPVMARVPDVDQDTGLTDLAEFAPQADVASWIYSDTDGLLNCAEQAIGSKPRQIEARRRRGLMGRQRVMRRHTYAHRAAEIVQHVERLQAAGDQ